MSLARLKWIAILTPVAVVAVLEYTRFSIGPGMDSWRGRILIDAVVVVGAVFFYGLLFSLVEQLRRRLERKNRELSTLYEAGLGLSSHLELESVLQEVVDQACGLLETRYGALSIYADNGRILSFVTSGITPEQEGRIDHPPVGEGLLGVVLHQGERLRLEELGSDSRSVGFPSGHPEMHSLLAVPILCRNSAERGNLYLSEKLSGEPFTEEDAGTLTRFATQAAHMVDNARLHERVAGLAVTEERLRISRELHDGQAQVLAYVSMKAQAAREHLRAGREERAAEQIEQLTKASREVYADVRDGITGLRNAPSDDRSLAEALREHGQSFQDQFRIEVQQHIDDVPRLPLEVELQALRIAQESLSNVRKHAGVDRLELTLQEAEGNAIRLRIRDQGRGFTAEQQRRSGRPRFGLATMRERAEAIDGRLTVDSAPDSGTCVELIVDLE